MAKQSINIEYECQSSSKNDANKKNAGTGSGAGASGSENKGITVNGLELDSLINLLAQSDSKYSTITIKPDNSILIS